MIKRLFLFPLLALLVAVSIAACTTPDQSKGPTYPVVGTVDQTSLEQSAFAARTTYAGLLRFAASYAALPRCTSMQNFPCSDQSAVNVLRKYDRAADTATKAAADIARNPTKSTVPLANAVADAQRAVVAFKATVEALSPAAAAASGS